MESASLLAAAFHRQAEADLGTLRMLEHAGDVPRCHRLQFFLMAAEKIAKAYMLRAGADAGSISRRHDVLVQFTHAAFSARRRRLTGGAERALRRTAVAAALMLEDVVPRAGYGRRNLEYPWVTESGVHAPCEHEFADIEMKKVPALRDFRAWIERMVEEF